VSRIVSQTNAADRRDLTWESVSNVYSATGGSIMKNRNLMLALAVAVASIFGTLVVEHLALAPVQAQTMVGDFALFAGVRRDTEKNQSFIFHNIKTGDIWVYEDAKVTDHYRIKSVGEDLEKIKVDR
jgi:hypothetical protein